MRSMEFDESRGRRPAIPTRHARSLPVWWLLVFGAFVPIFILSSQVHICGTEATAAEPPGSRPTEPKEGAAPGDRSVAPRFELPRPIAEASALIDRGRAAEGTAVLTLVGGEILVKEGPTLYKKQRAQVAKCQFYLGAYADCLDNAGPLLHNTMRPPFDARYYGALAAGRMQIWPLVLAFTANDPDGLARDFAGAGEKFDESQWRHMSLYLGVALARLDRFVEARERIEKLVRTTKNGDEAAALRLCIAATDERQRALRAKEIEPFNASVLWLAALDSPSWWVQTRAMREVARLPDARVYDKLAARLKHPRWEVRDAAVGALSARGDRRAIAILRPLLQDPNANVRGSAKLALKHLGEALD
jgi:hypothetical protein